MADKDSEKSGGDKAGPEALPEKPAIAEATPIAAKSDLPVVESPPLSPAAESGPAEVKAPSQPVAAEMPARDEAAAAPVAEAIETVPAGVPPRFAFNGRMRRHVLLAASVAFAAALGALIGALAIGGPKPVKPDLAALEERKAMQQSIANLAEEITALKGNLEAANKSAHTQLARISERLKRESAEITGSIAPPQTDAAAPAPAAPPSQVTPLPQPRPVRMTAAEPQRPPVVAGWTIHDVRDGYVYVQGYGDIYQVVPGAPLPGIGPVESIKRLDGRWMVVTPKGLIVAGRDRRYFAAY